MTAPDLDAALRAVLADVLALEPARVARFERTTPLFGALPELDSMAAANLLGALEDRFGIVVEPDEVDGEMMASFGSLAAYIERKTWP